MARSLEALEQEIADRKKKLDELWFKRNAAATLHDEGKEWDARFEIGKTALENCTLIAEYVRRVDAPVASELDERIKMVRQDLERLKGEKDLDRMHMWYKDKLSPLWNKAEQEWRLVSEMRVRPLRS